VLLKEWYSDNEQALADVATGQLSVETDCDAYTLIYHPRTWEQVLENDRRVEIWPLSLYTRSHISEDVEGETDTDFEDRVHYVVKYYLKTSSSAELSYLNDSTSDKPVVLEMTYGNGKVPALEVSKDVTMRRPPENTTEEDNNDNKHHKLGPHDLIKDAVIIINSP
jgi:hypothetical protein